MWQMSKNIHQPHRVKLCTNQTTSELKVDTADFTAVQSGVAGRRRLKLWGEQVSRLRVSQLRLIIAGGSWSEHNSLQEEVSVSHCDLCRLSHFQDKPDTHWAFTSRGRNLRPKSCWSDEFHLNHYGNSSEGLEDVEVRQTQLSLKVARRQKHGTGFTFQEVGNNRIILTTFTLSTCGVLHEWL